MGEVMDRIAGLGVVPVVVIEDATDAVALAQALLAGGLPVAELTFRTQAAVEAIRAVTHGCPDMLVGAGSVLLPEQVDAAVEAGARFIVSPGIDEEVVRRAQHHGVAALPGCAVPSDLMRARRLSLDVVKFFPSETLGGLTMLKAISAPFPGLRFVPTGGIEAANMGSYLADPRVLAVGGSWMVRPSLLAARDWGTISVLAREAVSTVASIRKG